MIDDNNSEHEERFVEVDLVWDDEGNLNARSICVTAIALLQQGIYSLPDQVNMRDRARILGHMMAHFMADCPEDVMGAVSWTIQTEAYVMANRMRGVVRSAQEELAKQGGIKH